MSFRATWYRMTIGAAVIAVLVLGYINPAVAAESRPATGDPETTRKLEFFEQKIRPLLVQRCFECHGPEAKSIKGGLAMTSHASLLKGGDTGPAIVPGNPAESLLIQSVRFEGLYEMPPSGRLPAAEVALLEEWVQDGAVWPGAPTVAVPHTFDLQARKSHWCWQPLRDPRPPEVRQKDWSRNGVDPFILSGLEAKQIAPAPPAPLPTLVRRLSFDLLGLPPDPEEVARVAQDRSPAALEQYMDRLLQSPQFGERWARHWMDLVRYAETYGHEFDFALPYAFEYRDYLIRAFNSDLPYDQFVREQIAGDLLERPRRHLRDDFNESLIGSGFWWLGEAVHAPTDVLTDEADRLDNMVDVMSKTFLGLTVACARCHDHKFDAISTQDYYSLVGYVQSSRRQVTPLDPGDKTVHLQQEMHTALDRVSREMQDSFLANRAASVDQFGRSLRAVRELVREGFLSDRAADAWLDPDATLGPGALALIDRVSGRCGVAAETLQRWSKSLLSHRFSAEHPLAVWREWIARERLAQSGQTANASADWTSFWNQRSTQLSQSHAAYQAYLNESPPLLPAWIPAVEPQSTSGFAFTNMNDLWHWDGASGVLRLRPYACVDSGLLSAKLRGAWRTPTFTLKEPRLHYRLAGRGGLVRVYIDGHFMTEFHQLLFASTYDSVDTQGEYRWFQQVGDLNKYVGHRVYLEIVDGGDGFMAVRDIRQSHRDPVEPPKWGELVELQCGAVPSPEALVNGLAKFHESALHAWKANQDDPLAHEWTRWMLQEELIEPMNSAVRDTAERVAMQVRHWEGELSPVRNVLASADGTGLDRPIYIRGNARSLGPMAPRRLPVAMGGEQQPEAPREHCGRKELADSILRDGQHFVARVIVNRLWHHVFGRGIVPTVDNFGVLGQPPTHPELLDYLAQELIRNDWSLKHVLRLLVQSSTYRMSSSPCPADEADPGNLLWHRTLVRRLQGEAIRDAMLQVSGGLRGDMYGASVPIHLTPFMDGRGRPGSSGPLDGNGRRSLYIEVRRNFLSPMMLAFDTPIPFNSIGQRSNSNVPAQALMLMNDPFVVQQAQNWAVRLLQTSGNSWLTEPSRERQTSEEQSAAAQVVNLPSDAATCTQRTTPAAPTQAPAVSLPPSPDLPRIATVYLRAFGRAPRGDEVTMMVEFLTQQRQRYSQLGWSADAIERQAWADVCHVIFNVKEFVYLY